MKAKNALVNELQKNEHVVQVISADQLMAEFDYRNIDYKDWAKTLSGYAAPAQDAWLAKTIVKEFGFSGKVVLKKYGSKMYVVLKGYPGKRTLLTGTKYLTSNPQVVRMAVGPKGVMKSVKGGFVLTLILSVGIEVVDYVLNDTRTLYDLIGTVTGDILKIGVAAICSAVTAALVGGAIGVATTAAAPLIAAVAVGVLVGWALNKIDDKVGATACLIEMYKQVGIDLEELVGNITKLPGRVVQPIANEAYRWERYFIQKALNSTQRRAY